MDDEEVMDGGKLWFVVVLFGLLVILLFTGWYFYHQASTQADRTVCESNPHERYLVQCTTRDDCIQQCITRRQAVKS